MFCPQCSRRDGVGAAALACPECGSPLELWPSGTAWTSTRDASRLQGRYGSLLPTHSPLTLGEPVTPLVEVDWGTVPLTLKLESALPTGSFKDRGAAVMVAWLAEHGIDHIVCDSSGNAGASFAAYSARAGIRCTVFVPTSTSRAKQRQIESFAEVRQAEGQREAAGLAAREFANGGTAVYVSHAWSPLFLAGTQTFAFEIFEQLDRLPDNVVVPVGAGTLYLGALSGFRTLRQLGLASRVPRLLGVQVDACAPLASAAAVGAPDPADVEARRSVAEGILTRRPPRGRQILEATRETGGAIVAVSEAAVVSALARLNSIGVGAEPTSAAALAGVDVLVARGLLREGERTVVAVTGHGLKALA